MAAPVNSSLGRTAALALLLAVPCRATDRFEIQVYDEATNDAGEFSTELHSNTSAKGHAVQHLTLEPALGLAKNWEMAGYVQSAVDAAGAHYAGVKLRSKVSFPGERWFAALNGEISDVPSPFEAKRWGGELRPIAGCRLGRWLFDVNPILSWSLTNTSPDLEPAGKIRYAATKRVGLGAEYYSGLGPIHRLAGWREQEHYLYGAFDLLGSPLELNVAIGRGLTAGSQPWTVKAILGKAF